MTDEEFLLQDRLTKIRSVFHKYGQDKFYISFSGGKDSCVLSALIDMAVPDNKIPRVFADTGIELNIIRDFVRERVAKDDRFQMIKPSVPIKKMLEEKGYPFKSKNHSYWVAKYQDNGCSLEGKAGLQKYVSGYYKNKNGYKSSDNCPNKLMYQFTPDFNIKISDRCCTELKEVPLTKWQKENHKPVAISGIMQAEGGRRKSAVCMYFSHKKLKAFHPLAVVTKEWEEWFINEYNVEICDIYKPPYNFKRTGCKGCPFTLDLQQNLDILQKYFPNERKQCEVIWKPIYDEYRRLGFRLTKKPNGKELF